MTNIEALLQATARACARGHNQLSFVNELLEWHPVVINYETIPDGKGGLAVIYGRTRLRGSSWRNLRLRLVQAGFIIVKYRDPWQLAMDHPARRNV